MNSLNSILELILFLLLLLLLNLLSPSLAAPGTQSCDIQRGRVLCFGPSITDTSLLMLKHELSTRHEGMYFSELTISSTSINFIGADVFTDVEFQTITIMDNEYLKSINETAFRAATHTEQLVIINNILLKDTTLYKLADLLAVKDKVDFEHNALEEVPSHAFNEVAPASTSSVSSATSTTALLSSHSSVQKLHLKNLVISNNQIRHISSNAFHLMDSVTEIALTKNRVEHIARHAFNLANHSKANLKIMLNSNSLSATSFEADFIELNNGTNLVLDLSHNSIDELKEAVFKPLLSKNVFIDLTGNKMSCHGANTAWLFKEENSHLLLKLKGISC